MITPRDLKTINVGLLIKLQSWKTPYTHCINLPNHPTHLLFRPREFTTVTLSCTICQYSRTLTQFLLFLIVFARLLCCFVSFFNTATILTQFFSNSEDVLIGEGRPTATIALAVGAVRTSQPVKPFASATFCNCHVVVLICKFSLTS